MQLGLVCKYFPSHLLKLTVITPIWFRTTLSRCPPVFSNGEKWKRNLRSKHRLQAGSEVQCGLLSAPIKLQLGFQQQQGCSEDKEWGLPEWREQQCPAVRHCVRPSLWTSLLLGPQLDGSDEPALCLQHHPRHPAQPPGKLCCPQSDDWRPPSQVSSHCSGQYSDTL